MNLVKLGKKGQVSIPQGVPRELGLGPDVPLLVETTPDGAIVLRQVSIHPVEMYGDRRLDEFAREDALTGNALARHATLLDRFNRQLGRTGMGTPAPDAALPDDVEDKPAPRARRAPVAGSRG